MTRTCKLGVREANIIVAHDVGLRKALRQHRQHLRQHFKLRASCHAGTLLQKPACLLPVTSASSAAHCQNWAGFSLYALLLR